MIFIYSMILWYTSCVGVGSEGRMSHCGVWTHTTAWRLAMYAYIRYYLPGREIVGRVGTVGSSSSYGVFDQVALALGANCAYTTKKSVNSGSFLAAVFKTAAK